MHKSRQAVSENTFSKVVFGLAVVLLVFAPPTARSSRAAEVYDFQICNGYFALCAASTCTPTGNQITVKPQPAALRRSRRRIVRVQSFSGRRLPTWPGATCKVLASRRDRAKSGRLISPDRTFPRSSPAGSRPPLSFRNGTISKVRTPASSAAGPISLPELRLARRARGSPVRPSANH